MAYYYDENGNLVKEEKKKKKKNKSKTEQTSSSYYYDDSGSLVQKSQSTKVGSSNYDHLNTQDEIRSELDPIKERNSFWSSIKDEAKALFGIGDTSMKELYSQREEDEANMSVLQQKLSARKAYDREQEFIAKYGNISANEDFAEKSAYKSTKNDKWWAGLTSQFGLRYDDLIYEYINNADLTRDEITRASGKFGEYSTEFRDKGYDRLTEDETKVYNYLYATGGKEAADEYLEGLAETLNTRKATADFENVEGKTALEILGGVHVGLDQAKTGLKNLGNMIEGEDEYIAPTSAQILGGMMREDLADDTIPIWYNVKEKKWEDEILGASAGQFAYDTVTTTANMVPSVATSAAIGVINPVAGAVAGGAMMGSSAAGNSYQWALSEGYDQDAARAYGTSIGVLEGSLQAALGGIGKLGGTSKHISKAVSGIDNALLRYSLKFGGQVGSEALEEGLQEILDPILQKAILGADAEVDWEEVMYSALLGGVMGGVMGGDSNGLSHNEQKVVNKVYETELAQKEADGKTLTKKDKSKLYDSVVERLEKGQLDIDTIDSMYGGEGYTAYQSESERIGKSYAEYLKAVEEDKARATELEELGKKEGSTPADNYRYTELMQQQKDSEATQAERKAQHEADLKKLLEMRKKLTDDVVGKVGKDSKLVESYREYERSFQKFKADPKQYKDEHARQTIQNIMDSGLATNTNEMHEVADWLAKMASHRGVAFTLADAERLKGTHYEYKGKTTNAFLNESTGEVTLNIDAKKPLNSTVGHELAHVLEGTEFYEDFKNNFKTWANKKNGEWDARIKATQELYAQRDENGNIVYDENGNMVYIKQDVNIENEVMADLIGDYIFTDKDFIKHLSVEQPNAFKRFWDEVKFMIKCAKAGSEVEKELLHLEKEFAQIWRESGKYQPKTAEAKVNETVDNVNETVDTDDAGEGDVQFSISVTDPDTLDSLNKQVEKGAYDAETNPDGGYYVTYKSMSFWGYDEDGNAILRSPMAEYVDGELSNAYLIPKDKSKLNWYQATETIDDTTGLPSGLLVKTKQEGKKSFAYLPASENQHLINEDWSNLYFNLRKKVQRNGKWVNSDVPARYNPYEHSSNSMLNDQFSAAYLRDNLVTVKMYVPVSEDNGAYRAKWSKDPTGWADWKSGIVAGKIGKQKDLQRRVYLSRYAAPVEIVPDSEVAQAYKGYLEGTDVAIPDNVVSPNLLTELRNAGVPIEESGKVKSADIAPVAEADTSGVKFSFTGETKDGRRCYESGFGEDVSMDERIDIFKGRIATIFNLGAVELKTDVKKIQVRGDKFTMKENLYGDRMGQDGEKEAKISSLYDLADILATSKYDPSETNKEPSYENPSVKPKNPAHKGVKYWYKFKNEIVFDGVPYTVTFNIRDKGGEQYQYLIDFKENKTPGLSTTAVKSLLQADRVSTEDSIAPLPENVNTQFSKNNTNAVFSLSNTVEETKDLMALHNMKANELLKTLELGGLPMPSIAVIKAQQGHEQYGDVSLILPKESIDPKANKDNKVYGGDAWTPTYPKIEYKTNEAVGQKISDKYYELAEKIGYDEVRPMYRYVNELEDSLNRDGGEEAMLERLYEDTGMMQVYLQDSGKGKVQPVVKETRTEITPAEAEMNQFIIDALGEDFVASFKAPDGENPMKYRSAFMEQHEAEIREAYKRYFAEVHGFTAEEIDNVFANIAKRDLMKIMRGAYMFTQNNGVTVRTETDHEATREAIRTAAQDGYKEWVDGLFKGVSEKSGIYNGSDYFTRSGNRRSWEALHWENTLENVVKAMRNQNATGADAIFAAHQIFATSAKEYGSIADIKADSDRLTKIPEEEYEAIKESYENRFSAIANRIMDKDHRNEFVARENAMEAIVDAVRNSKTKDGIAKELSDYPNLTVTQADVDDIVSLVSDIANMPTGYFEAKPQRAVGLEEVGVFVIPRNSDIKLKQELLNRGYSIAEYDPDVGGDRQRVVNGFEEYKFSLSDASEQPKVYGDFAVYGKDIKYKPFGEDLAPIGENVERTTVGEANDSVGEADADGYPLPDDIDEETGEDIIKTVKDKLNAKVENSTKQLEEVKQQREQTKASYESKIAELQALYDSKKNKDTKAALGIQRRITNLKRLAADRDVDFQKQISGIEERISKTEGKMQDPPKKDILEVRYERINKQLEADKAALAEEYAKRKADAEKALADKPSYISDKAFALYNEVKGMKKGVRVSNELGYLLDNLDLSAENKADSYKRLRTALLNIKNRPSNTVNQYSEIESIAREMLNASYEDAVYELDDMDNQYQQEVSKLEADAEKQRESARKAEERVSRSALHGKILDNIKSAFGGNGFDFDEVLKKAKNLSTFSTVDNTPQRVMEKALGYKEGQILADLTVNKVAQNESEGIKWLNSFTERKNGLLAQISKQYRIKPGSKESAAAQMYAEGFYVNDKNEIIAYGDAELAQDFPDNGVQQRIKGLAADERIRQIYDETLKAINESRARNGYPEIQRLDNYFLHFRAMDDTFSKLGLPFNPNDIRAKDLPTDLNGVTADLKPGQPYFASAMHRTGKRTSFDLLGGLERYLTSAKNQIYHIDDIQTLRALRNYIADTYGQANGLEGIDVLSEEEAQDRIEKVYNSHLSTFAKFLNEEANILAGKTSLIDRGIEGAIGRRAMTFLDTVNRQTGSNMVGFNISSSLTNFLPVAQAFAKTNKFDFLKAFTQTVSNKLGSIVGKSDNFTENSPVVIRRKGADRFYRTPFQKAGDAGYILMSAVDDISTELIARTKYNELTRKGMDEQTAHFETDKWVSRLMGDRSLGQQPQLYNSKTLGVITKFQLEVRNQLDSQFYDTIQEAKVSSEDIENGLARNAKIAAKVTSTFVQLAVVQHLFGKAFESVAGYNPAFDIISVLATMFGWDDEEESEDTALDNIEQGFLELLEDLPYTSTLTGGRIPIASALPIAELIKGEDSYGNEKSRWETVGETLPYYILPGGYGQIKKTAAGLNMFSDDHPVSGSYTDSGNLRFPVEDTLGNKVQAALFGQYASENAREYFDNDYAPLGEKQIQEYIDVDLPISEYRDIREGLNDIAPLPGNKSATLEQKADYIDSLDLPTYKKNILVNNLTTRKDEIDMEEYSKYDSLEEYDFATKNPEKYAIAKTVGGYSAYKTYSDALGDIHADKDENGKSISGSRKEKVIDYINNLDADYYTKIILHKSEYPSDDTYNQDIVDYVVSHADLTYEERVALLTELGFRVAEDGQIYDAD